MSLLTAVLKLLALLCARLIQSVALMFSIVGLSVAMEDWPNGRALVIAVVFFLLFVVLEMIVEMDTDGG